MHRLFAGLAFAGVISLAAQGASAQSAVAQPAAVHGKLSPDKPGPAISKNIYGQFSEHLGSGIYDGVWVGPNSKIPNVRGIRSDVVQALRDVHVPVIRWPGGCFADEYVWRDGVGPADKRPVRKNNWWGGSPESNQFGTHEFFDFAEQIGADVYLAVNVGSSTPTVMREWIEYLTSPGDDTLARERRANGRDKPFKVPYIGIGNESWGCGGSMTPEYYANEYRRFEAFFHKNADNPALRVAAGASETDTHWTDVVMRDVGAGRMDAISLHFYTVPSGSWSGPKGPAVNFTRQDWFTTMARTLRMDDIITQHAAVMDKYDPRKRVGLYVDEWGSWYDVEQGTNPGHLYQLNTLRDGVIAAANFNIFHHHTDRVKMANLAQTINVLQAMILTKEDKIVLTPTYYAFKMYLPFQDSTYLPLDITAPTITSGDKSIPAFNVSAARGKDGKTYIGVANMDPDNAANLDIDLGGLAATQASGEVMTAAQMNAMNEIGKPPAVAPVAYTGGRIANGRLALSIPSKSVVVVRLD